jgi:putative transposase
MPFIKAWIHVVWATKQRMPLLTNNIRTNIFAHIKENAITKGIYMDCVNGHIDHVHALISLGAEQSISKIVQLIKGESSFWINKHGLTKTKLEWQDDYFAVSVSESNLEVVRAYIKNQEIHHQKKTFLQEHDEFIKKYGFALIRA